MAQLQEIAAVFEARNLCEMFIIIMCLQVLDGIQDNYTFAQPGIQTKIRWEIAVHI